jgi:hypothetical protein
VVESNLLASAVVRMQELRGGREWRDTPDATLNKLNEQASDRVRRSREWPLNSVWLTRRLRPLVPTLDALGIEVTLDAQLPNKSRAIVIRTRAPRPSAGHANAPEQDATPEDQAPEEEPEPTSEEFGLGEEPEPTPKEGEPAEKVRRSF